MPETQDVVTILLAVTGLVSVLLAYFLNSRCTRCTVGGDHLCEMERDPLPPENVAQP